MELKRSEALPVGYAFYRKCRSKCKFGCKVLVKTAASLCRLPVGASLLLCLVFIYYTKYSLIEHMLLYRSLPIPELSNESLILYRAYLLDRRIRVLSINRCVNETWKLNGSVNGRSLTFEARSIERRCPWGWAKGCLYNSYLFDAALENVSSAERVTLWRNGGYINLPLHRPPQRAKDTLSVCVPPMYWFTDWPKLIFFLESWRAHGASHAFIYYHSSTQEVRRVLEQYKVEKFVTVIDWPLLPRSSTVDPNRSVYRLAHSLAHNDCVQRINTEFGALVDIDELMVPRNGSLLSFVIERFSSPSIGALCFPHRAMFLDPPLTQWNFAYQSLDFSGIVNAFEAELQGPYKVIFRADAVHTLSTHQVRMFRAGFSRINIPPSEAVLLHNRYPSREGKNRRTTYLFPFDIDVEMLREAMVTKKRAIFPKGANFHFDTQMQLHRCLDGWQQKQNNCKVPISGCQDVLMPLENWHFTRGSDGFLHL